MRAAARVLLRCAAGGLLALALFVQFFIAGMAALTNPEWWSYHLTWVAFFQWIVVPLPVLAWLAGPPLPMRVTLACVPFVQMGLQYMLVHRALDGRLPIGLGLHSVNAALMLVVVLTLAADWSMIAFDPPYTTLLPDAAEQWTGLPDIGPLVSEDIRAPDIADGTSRPEREAGGAGG